ncbi:diguanylate cyclase domain-containing protein [Insolitispirillum peregrinum]|uniref:PAS domain S-box-containing protein/diguanylate cyclase (GGDEF) domain-containing protein n=1 Tax=Insolitispirillum peregrinum TaxID=80876 RepID=A0A1N7Q9Y6_9PROT|nr:diguanylate cyclase [Insolitispirillum peregrinum]SIT19672.1 PAS domain S-box-containing protein/diguanylate cyclase (GGDEF) domain-containing protein [Insolitispirillum peregrinum]
MGSGCSFPATSDPQQGEQPFATLRFDALCRTIRAVLNVALVVIHLDPTNEWGTPCIWHDTAPEQTPPPWQDLRLPAGSQPTLLLNDAHAHPDLGLPPWVRFYASLPIGPDGAGRVTVIDSHPQPITASLRQRLDDCGAIADQCLRLHTAARDAEEQEAEFRLLTETSTDTIVRGTLDGVRLYISPSVRTLLGYEPDELIGQRAITLTHPDDVPAFAALMQKVRNGTLEVGISEQRQRHKNGSWVWLEAFVRLTHDRHSGLPNGYVSSVRGVDHRKRVEAHLTQLASHDPLTGLPNRSLFRQQLQDTLATGHGAEVMVFYMDLDRFKQVNDTLGHQSGDSVLREVAHRLRAILRPTDCIARLGGDEFTALLVADRLHASDLAARLVATIAAPIPCGGTQAHIGLSIGIACFPDHGRSAEALLVAADQALYRAKAAGRNGFCFFTPDQENGGQA